MTSFHRLALCSLIVAGSFAPHATFAAPAAHEASKATLAVGAPAPAFKAGRWVKGTPVQAFKKGQYYVVEFWATWCGPCKMTIPHLTELAKEYQGKVTFIGVDILEEGHGGDPAKADEKVDKFVAGMGATMDYPVCRDTAEGFLEKTWFKAGNFGGIPACYVVDGKGAIAWMGHPMYLNAVLPEVFEPKFNAKAFAVSFAKREKAMNEIQEAARSQEWPKVLELCDAYLPLKTDKSNYKELYTFQALLHVDGKRAETYFTTLKEQPEGEAIVAQIIGQEKGLDKVWYERAIPLLEKLCAKEKGYDLKLLASAYQNLGQKDKAVALMTSYIDWLKAEKTKEPDKAASYDYMLREARADLAEMKE
jgi:thiol-disulfide isomerase/thioredoxin